MAPITTKNTSRLKEKSTLIISPLAFDGFNDFIIIYTSAIVKNQKRRRRAFKLPRHDAGF
jgi:hypothetical protein